MGKLREIKKIFEKQNDEFIMNFFKDTTNLKIEEFIIIVLCIKDPILREETFNSNIALFEKFDIKTLLKAFTHEELQEIGHDFLNKMKPTYVPLKAIFVVASQNTNLIIESFNEAQTVAEKMEYIKNVHYTFGPNNNLEAFLINQIDDSEIRYLLDTNEERKKDIYTTNNNIKLMDISPEITIGVELEVVHDKAAKLKNIPSLFGTFEIINETTLENEFEVISPILHYTNKDLTTLASVCDTLEKMGFSTNGTGGHIHIGANYLKSKEDYAMFLYLYGNCENIIYKITDRASTQKRKNALTFASKIKEELLESITSGELEENNTLLGYIYSIKKISKTRCRGLNLQNINNPEKNTIEFRMGNGEISFKELLANINLFTRLIQVSHDLNTKENQNPLVKKIGQEPDERKRLDLLLDLLFTTKEEKEIYKERYESNTKIINIIDGITHKIDHTLIDIDAKRKLSKKVI